MKIIVTIDGNIPSKRAHSFNVAKMTQGFVQAVCNAELVSLLSWPNIKEWMNIGSIHKHYGIDPVVKIKLIPVWNKHFSKKTIGAKDWNKKAVKYFKKKKPDFVYCRSYKSVTECVKNEIPCFIETHTTLYENKDLQEVFKIAKNPYFIGLVTINDILKKEYAKRGVPENKILTLEDGVDLSRFDINNDRIYWRKTLGLPKDKKLLLYSGGLFKEKGIESILLTHKELMKKRNDILTIFIGGQPDQIKEWKDYCKKNNIEGCLFKGFMANSELPKYMKAADVLMMPYDTGINYQVMDLNTTSPLKLFEYMGAKRPVLSNKLPVVEKIVEHNASAMLAAPDDIKEQAKLVNELLENPAKADKIANTAYEIAKRYDWKERCKEIIKMFLKSQ